MVQLGYYAMCAALFSSFLAVGLGTLAFRTGRDDHFASARYAVFTTAFLATLACAGIVYAFLAGDYGLVYVWANSDRDMPLFFKLGALWGGQSGSLLFWSWILSMYAFFVALRHRDDHVRLLAPTLSTLMLVLVFFLALVVFGASPFRRGEFIPLDGIGLNPLLQHPAMVIHPPCLYLGLVGFAVPFAFAVGALISGRLDDRWLKCSRHWAILAWIFLGAGNILGGWWAYLELGWGGYWAWDPVENASFMPWLAGTAFIHSVMIQERSQMFRIWNIVLIMTTFLLTVFGTFITRSGLVTSVHSFAQSSIGYWFAGFLFVTVLVSVSLVLWRSEELESEQHLDSFFSREAAFLLNNFILLGGAFAVLWGTLFPMFREALTGDRIFLGPAFFNQIMIPVGLALLLLMGVGPRLPWRRMDAGNLPRVFGIPIVLAVLAGIVLRTLGVSHSYALVTFSLCAFVLVTIVDEFRRGILAQRRQRQRTSFSAFISLFGRGRRRYAGHIVHLGVVIIFIGFAGAAFSDQADATLQSGETWSFRDFNLTYRGLKVAEDNRVESVAADVLVEKGQVRKANLLPRKDWFKKSQQMATEVAIHSTLGSDLYLILASFDEVTETASFKVYWNPLVSWYWIGGVVMILGGILVLFPGQKGPQRRSDRFGMSGNRAELEDQIARVRREILEEREDA